MMMKLMICNHQRSECRSEGLGPSLICIGAYGVAMCAIWKRNPSHTHAYGHPPYILIHVRTVASSLVTVISEQNSASQPPPSPPRPPSARHRAPRPATHCIASSHWGDYVPFTNVWKASLSRSPGGRGGGGLGEGWEMNEPAAGGTTLRCHSAVAVHSDRWARKTDYLMN